MSVLVYCKTHIFRVTLFLQMANQNFREHVFFVNGQKAVKTEDGKKTVNRLEK